MRTLIIAALMLAVASPASATRTNEQLFGNVKNEQLFASFKTRYNRQYKTPAEEERRFAIFSANMRRAAELDSKNPQASFGVTKLADKTKEEFHTHHTGLMLDHKRLRLQKELAGTVSEVTPDCTFIDWRLKGAVTPVKNQEECGGCWSFSVTGNIEGQWALAGHPLVSLSEQELISCDMMAGMNGCMGGDTAMAMNFLLTQTNGTIAESSVYPFTNGDGPTQACNDNFHKFEVGATIIGFHNIPSSESHMAHWLCHGGPVSISIDAEDVQLYTGGIMTVCSRNVIDHAILLVGMNLAYRTPYWIIKNSWGADWGEEGYFRVEYGKDLCAITTEPLTALV